jgi:hypothetical protein
MPTALAARARTGRDVPAAVSTAVAPLLAVPARGTVLACFPSAVYVLLPGAAVLALVTSDGLRLPNALVVAATSRDAPFGAYGPGSAAGTADGALVLDGVRHRPVRRWTPRERTAGALQPAAVAELADRLPAPPHPAVVADRLHLGATRLARALSSGDGSAAAADALLGLGPGLTPAGDDLLAAALVTSAQLGHPRPSLAARVHERGDVTTALSADLLRHAAAGRAAPPVLDLLDALVGARPVGPALAALLAVGSTSGHDTATGVLLAARALLTRRHVP